MKQSVVSALVFGLVSVVMLAPELSAASTDLGQPAEVVVDKDELPTQTARPHVRAPHKATGVNAPGSDRMFNPQPELPERKLKAAGTDAPGSDRMFNPQPELPERKMDGAAVTVAKPGSDRTFNPQPELPEKPAPAKRSK